MDLRLPLARPKTFRQRGLPPCSVVAMGSTASKPDPQYSTPLECLLANLRTLRLKGYIRPKQLTFLCSQAWPQYPLDNGSQWPTTGTLDFDVLRDLDNYCRRTGKWSEVPYVCAFWALRSRPTLSESSAFSVPPEDLVAPPPYTSHTAPPLPLRVLPPPPPLWPLLPPLPPPRFHRHPWILQPLALSCILLFPP